jgi:hypothetical protein
MIAIAISLLVGLMGVVASRAALGHLAVESPNRDPHVDWVLGLVALVPAWLVVFLALLGPTSTPRKDLVSAVSWVLSAGAGLIGAIATEGSLRRASESGRLQGSLACWRLGLVGFAPAWLIALAGQAEKTISE